MKKLISILFILLILCGCSSITLEGTVQKLDTVFDNYATYTYRRTNNNTKYYSFYLPSDVQEIEFDDTYHHFVFNSSDFIMNLNVNYILCENVFFIEPENPFSYLKDYIVYQKDNTSNSDSPYHFCLYLVDNQYYFSYYTDKMTFSGKTELSEVKELLEHIIKMNASSELSKDTIVNDYYQGAIIEYSNKENGNINGPVQKDGNIIDILDQDLKAKLEEAEKEAKESQ